MIRTLIVDDDFMAVSVHRDFTARVAGFEVVADATSGRQGLARIAAMRPDLVLLDMYLPDLTGIELLRQLRAGQPGSVDVIAITAAKDVDMLRAALHLGVVHYIVKPFTFRTFRERLETYAAARARLDRMHQPEQRDIDRLYGLLRTSTEDSLPKGISAPTLALLGSILRGCTDGMSAAELSNRAGLSPGVARRYLKFLADSGAVALDLRYGTTGRPEHRYHWADQPAAP